MYFYYVSHFKVQCCTSCTRAQNLFKIKLLCKYLHIDQRIDNSKIVFVNFDLKGLREYVGRCFWVTTESRFFSRLSVSVTTLPGFVLKARSKDHLVVYSCIALLDMHLLPGVRNVVHERGPRQAAGRGPRRQNLL